MSERDDLAALIELTEFGYDTERRPPSAWGYALADAIMDLEAADLPWWPALDSRSRVAELR